MRPVSLASQTRIRHLLALTALAVLGCSAVSAQQFEKFGEYEVHYSTMNTNLLSPEVAQNYGIQRSASRAMLNITVLHNDNGNRRPVTAAVAARATNLTGQMRNIVLQEVREQDAIYYIGTFRVHNQETLNFEVSVNRQGSERPVWEFSFRQQFFTEN